MTSFGPKFPAYFAASKDLQIARGDVPVERLSLERVDAAVSRLRQCVADQAGEPVAAADNDADPNTIPEDPFAATPKRGSKK